MNENNLSTYGSKCECRDITARSELTPEKWRDGFNKMWPILCFGFPKIMNTAEEDDQKIKELEAAKEGFFCYYEIHERNNATDPGKQIAFCLVQKPRDAWLHL